MFLMLPILPNYLLCFDSKAQGLMRIFLRCLLFASKYFSHWEFTNLHWMTHLPMIPILAILRYCLIIFSLEYLALFLNYYSFCLFAAEVEMMVLLHSTSSKVADQYINTKKIWNFRTSKKNFIGNFPGKLKFFFRHSKNQTRKKNFIAGAQIIIINNILYLSYFW
jgi:hypothetical protein